MDILFLCLLLIKAFVPTLSITREALVTDLVYLDIDIGGSEAGRIVVGLFGATTPKTVQNFISLAKHEVMNVMDLIYGYTVEPAISAQVTSLSQPILVVPRVTTIDRFHCSINFETVPARAPYAV